MVLGKCILEIYTGSNFKTIFNLGISGYEIGFQKGLKEIAIYYSMQLLSERKDMIGELLYGFHDEDLRTLLEYKKMLWQAGLKQDMPLLRLLRAMLSRRYPRLWRASMLIK